MNPTMTWQYPPTIIYGTAVPDIRLKQRAGTQIYFCRNNRNLHLTAEDFDEGTFSAGKVLGGLCQEKCAPLRQKAGIHEPCPAWVEEWQVGTENKGLASVTMRSKPKWAECSGAKVLLDSCQTKEERFFLEAYLDSQHGDEADWRNYVVRQWNAYWHRVPNGWNESSRRGKFDSLMWSTLRFPALIPQVWLNWLANASDEDMKLLEENPSRVDFVALHSGQRHVIEIDGPSHYCDYEEQSGRYSVNERAYARNLKIERSLRRDGWEITRIARVEVRDGMGDDFEDWMKLQDVLDVLPFHEVEYPDQLSSSWLGVAEIDQRPPDVSPAPATADDDIPF